MLPSFARPNGLPDRPDVMNPGQLLVLTEKLVKLNCPSTPLCLLHARDASGVLASGSAA
jgi:hypothetical protein